LSGNKYRADLNSLFTTFTPIAEAEKPATLSSGELEAIRKNKLDKLAKVKTAEDLTAWEKEMQEEVLSDPILASKLGMNADTINELIKAKKTELANDISIEALTPGTLVKLKGEKSPFIVLSNDGNSVNLKSVKDYKAKSITDPITINKEDLKDKIKAVNGPYAEFVEQETPPTAEEVEANKEVMESAKVITPEEEIAMLDEYIAKTKEVVDQEAADAFKNCKL